MNFSEILDRKRDNIVEQWIRAVFADRQIEATNELTFKAVRNSLPQVLKGLATVLSQTEDNELQTIVEASLEHGIVRAEQGFEPSEIAREYRLLRTIIFSALEEDLLQATPKEVLRTVRLIDMIIDEAIARCFNSYTEARLSELEQLRSQMQLTNQELTRLVRVNRSSVSHMAHELKTPLTSIIGYADTFLRQQQQPRVKDAAPNLESIEQVLRSGRILLRLVNNTLEIAREGQLLLQPTEVEPQALIQAVIEMVKPLARAKSLALVVECDRAPETVVTDPLRLQQILTNLVNNAIQYTDSGSVIVTCQTLKARRWSITVADSGVGIDPAEQTQIFDAYFRTADATDINDAGTGLGLAIVAQLVKLMQGTVQVASTPGEGAAFTVAFPLDIAAANSLRR